MYFTLLLKLDIINGRKQLAHVQMPKQKVNPYPEIWWTKRKKISTSSPSLNSLPHWRSNLFRIIPFISQLNPTLSWGGGGGDGRGGGGSLTLEFNTPTSHCNYFPFTSELGSIIITQNEYTLNRKTLRKKKKNITDRLFSWGRFA